MLNNRLLAIADYVPQGSKILDVGCDHAYLSIYLAQHKKPQSVIASDIVTGPVEAARKNIRMAGLQDKIRLVQADGLLGVRPGETDCVIIAGMGAGTIIEILTAGAEVVKQCSTLILQPMIGADKLRIWLADNAWSCARETLCLDNNRLYEIIVAKPASAAYTINKLQALVGDLRGHELFDRHLQNLVDKYQQLSDSLHRATDISQVQERLDECKYLLEKLREVKHDSKRDK